MIHITIVRSTSGDWSGVFFDQCLVTEGHSVRYDDLLDAIVEWEDSVGSWTSFEVDEQWLEKIGSFPNNLALIPEFNIRKIK